jgi:hypothetical protein
MTVPIESKERRHQILKFYSSRKQMLQVICHQLSNSGCTFWIEEFRSGELFGEMD